ncbi:uncharacterized protein BKCO1_6400047 [Diplodia corticola]|uniref:Uncharacterized protein n=1 Tax=Diplodia corticola TaxID=236234 RepID=A0A1J9RQN2_9PEZI|nr:uncharacterized protein BKCO1_6400047 [Diplodia corticola]OJD30212.1 hypothetical protein BKCO1_6400047 [Diplodia corticola]
MDRIPEELIVMIIESSLEYETNLYLDLPPMLTPDSVETVLNLRAVNRTFARCSSGFIPGVLELREMMLAQTDLNMLELMTRNQAICSRFYSLAINIEAPIRGLFDNDNSFGLDLVEDVRKYRHAADMQWGYYPEATNRLAVIFSRLHRLKRVTLYHQDLNQPAHIFGSDMWQAEIKSLEAHPLDVKGILDVDATCTGLRALLSAESKVQRVDLADLPLTANNLDSFCHLDGHLPSVRTLEISLSAQEGKDIFHNSSKAIHSVFAIFPNVDNLCIDTIYADSDAQPHVVLEHAMRQQPGINPFIHTLTRLQLSVCMYDLWIDPNISSLVCHFARTLRHLALQFCTDTDESPVPIREFIDPMMMMATMRLETFFLQFTYSKVEGLDALPCPMPKFADRVFVRHADPGDFSDGSDVIDETGDEWTCRTGDFELWFGDAEDKGRKEVWEPREF